MKFIIIRIGNILAHGSILNLEQIKQDRSAALNVYIHGSVFVRLKFWESRIHMIKCTGNIICGIFQCFCTLFNF